MALMFGDPTSSESIPNHTELSELRMELTIKLDRVNSDVRNFSCPFPIQAVE